nr:reverse transcriptase domain-containing protein [Tanacetum cinerariifolium]
MSTRSSTRNLCPPLDNPELTIRRRCRGDPTLLNGFEMATEGNGDPPVPNLRTMEELCQSSLNGRGGPIAPIAVQATSFRLKNDMIQQLRNEITNFRQRPDESLFKAWERYKLSIDRCLNHNMLPVTQIDTFYNGLTLRHRDTINAVAGGTFMKRCTEECYDLIENMTAHHNDWDTSAQQTTIGQTQNVYAARAYQGGNSYQPQVEHETEVTKDTVPPTNNRSTKDVQPPVVQIEALILNFEPVVAPVAAPVTNYNNMTANRIDVIDMDCEEYSQEVLGFFDVIASGNPTPYYDPIVSTFSPTLTPFGDSDFLLEEVDAFLALEDDSTLPKVDHSYYETEGDIFLFEAFLNDDPSLLPPTQGMYLPQVQKELKICEAKNDKSSIDEPPEVKLKDLPPHLEYAFLEGDDKLPVIIAKDLSVEEKATLIKVLESHKQAIAWKLSDIKGINPGFYTHKILMEDDFEPAI